jgi:hypothetical protein
MASLLGDFVCGTRNLLSQGFRSLPAILSGASLLLGTTQGNINFIFFFIGMTLLAPILAFLVNGLLELVFANVPALRFPDNQWLVDAATAEQCAVFAIGSAGKPVQPINVVPTYWMTMMAFFFTYLFINAYKLYGKQETSKASPSAILARKSQTLISMIVLCLVAILVLILRFATSCETAVGIFVAWLLGGYAAYLWYSFMRACGLGRLDDLYGISNRLLPEQSYEEQLPTVCLPLKDE